MKKSPEGKIHVLLYLLLTLQNIQPESADNTGLASGLQPAAALSPRSRCYVSSLSAPSPLPDSAAAACSLLTGGPAALQGSTPAHTCIEKSFLSFSSALTLAKEVDSVCRRLNSSCSLHSSSAPVPAFELSQLVLGDCA